MWARFINWYLCRVRGQHHLSAELRLDFQNNIVPMVYIKCHHCIYRRYVPIVRMVDVLGHEVPPVPKKPTPPPSAGPKLRFVK